MSEPFIRHAAADDLPRIHQISVAAWTPIYEHRRKYVVGDEIFKDLWGGWRQHQRVAPEAIDRAIVTVADGIVIGFATWRQINHRAGEILSNAIDPPWQGRGLGVRQIRRVMEILKAQGCECASVFTGLDPAHAPARGQYYAVGLTRHITTSVYMNPVSAVPNAYKPPGVTVRRSSHQDLPALMEIVDSVWTSIIDENNRRTGGLFALCYPNAIADKKQSLSKWLMVNPASVLLACQDTRPVGFCHLDLDPAKNSGTIDLLGVEPQARHMGAATALVLEAARILRERALRYIWLKAGPGENTEATRGLCHKIGLHREIPSVWLFGAL